MKDLNNTSRNDYNYLVDVFDITDPLIIFLNQIKILFGATKGSVLGAGNMPIDLEAYVYETSINESRLQENITTAINTHCTLAEDYPFTVDVKFAAGSVRDICIIDIDIKNGGVIKYTIK